MNRKLSLLTIALAALALSACSPKADEGEAQPDVAIPSRATALQFSSGIPADQSAALKEAISSLYVLPVSSANADSAKLQSLLKTDDVSPEGLQSWMQARVQYIVNEKFDFTEHASINQTPFTYQEAQIFPEGFASLKSVKAQKGYVMMANIGAWVYAKGKKLNVLINLDIPGVGSVPLKSPRTGLLQIGEGLFMPLDERKTQNIAIDVWRLAILFHEARHSDGHGHTLAFMHAVCPRGLYKGKAACDSATNGPYTVGATVMKALMNECSAAGTCTTRSNEILKVAYLDQASRLLDYASGSSASANARAGVDWDDAPEGVR